MSMAGVSNAKTAGMIESTGIGVWIGAAFLINTPRIMATAFTSQVPPSPSNLSCRGTFVCNPAISTADTTTGSDCLAKDNFLDCVTCCGDGNFPESCVIECGRRFSVPMNPACTIDDNGRDSCCKQILERSPCLAPGSSGAGAKGTVICCRGRMTVCVFARNLSEFERTAEEILIKCTIEHESEHVRQNNRDCSQCPAGKICMPAIPATPGGVRAIECPAYRISLECLLANIGLCDQSPDRVRCREAVRVEMMSKCMQMKRWGCSDEQMRLCSQIPR